MPNTSSTSAQILLLSPILIHVQYTQKKGKRQAALFSYFPTSPPPCCPAFPLFCRASVTPSILGLPPSPASSVSSASFLSPAWTSYTHPPSSAPDTSDTVVRKGSSQPSHSLHHAPLPHHSRSRDHRDPGAPAQRKPFMSALYHSSSRRKNIEQGLSQNCDKRTQKPPQETGSFPFSTAASSFSLYSIQYIISLLSS